MSNALQIGGHNVVLCVRSEFLTLKKAIIRYEHNVREVKHASKIGYLRGNSRNNRYLVLSEYNDNGNMREMPSSDREFNDRKYIKALLKKYHEKMKADYEAQSKTYKNGRVVKNHWRDNMVGFSEVVISFGTERPKDPKEGLNQTEVNFVNAQVSLDRVLKFARLYRAKYGVKCLLVVEHNDEKTKHYQLIFTNYLFQEHKNTRFNGKDETIENLQDKLTISENFKTKVINFILKISNLTPNFSKLLDDEPTEIKNEIKGKYSRDRMEI